MYRSDGRGDGVFERVLSGPATFWPGGDPAAPAAGSAFAYVATALNGSGVETSPGAGTDGAPRVLSGTPCPP